jgi:hypothetical protein
MARNNFYNRATTTVVIDGVTVKGIAPGNAIRVIEEADGATTVKGLDRAMTNINNDLRARLEIDLLPTSAYIAVAAGLKRRQAEGTGRLLDGSVRSGVNELEKLQGMALARRGDMQTGGEEGQNRTVIFTVEKAVGDET